MTLRVRVAHLDDAGPIARVQVDAWRTTYAGIVPTAYLAGRSSRDRESQWTDILSAGRPPESNFVAETDGGEIVGFAGGGPEREGNPTYRGELYAVYLLEQYQGRGRGPPPRLGRGTTTGRRRLLLDAGVGTRGQSSGVHLLRGAWRGESRPPDRYNRRGAPGGDVSYGWNDIAHLAADETRDGRHAGWIIR